MLILEQVRLSKGQLCLTGLGKGLEYGPAGANTSKNTPSNNFSNPMSSITPGSAPDPIFLGEKPDIYQKI